MKLSHCELFHFDFEAQRSRLFLCGLSESDSPLAQALQRALIPHADRLIASLSQRMRLIPELQGPWAKEGAHLEQALTRFVKGLGPSFCEPLWFEERLREGLSWARRGVSWATYFCLMRHLEELVMAALEAQNGQAQALVRRLFTLDMSLTSEGFQLVQVERFGAAVDELHSKLTVDPLTGVSTRTNLLAAIDLKLKKVRRDGHRFCLVMIDVDHFKRVNDEYGHLGGDAVLKAVANRLRAALRQSDLVGRYGGEEFIILLDDAEPAGAANLAERLREHVSSEGCDFQGAPIAVTISQGVVEAQPADSRESLIARADAALYEAKRGGRNRVVTDFTGPKLPLPELSAGASAPAGGSGLG